MLMKYFCQHRYMLVGEAMRNLRLLSGVLLATGLMASGHAQLARVDSSTAHQNFVVTGTSTRQWAGHQANPFNLTLSGITNGASIKRAYLNWSYLTDDTFNLPEAHVEFDGINVIGLETGRSEPDLGWGRQYTAAYTADVTSLITGNGTHTIRDAVDVPTAGQPAIGEGMSLLVIYEHPDEPERRIDVYNGLWSTMADETPIDITGVKRLSRDLRLFTNALDGQEAYSDDFMINGSVASFLAPGNFNNAFQGALGPGPLGENYYDHFDNDIGAFVLPHEDSFTFHTLGHVNGSPGYDDTIAHTFAAVSFEPVPEPATLCILSLGAGFFLKSRKGGHK